MEARVLALVVDDDEILRKMIAEFLEDRFGVQAMEAENAKQALELIRKYGVKISLIISDVNLGKGLTGFDINAYCKMTIPEVPVIMASGHPDSPRIAKALDAEHFLIKPFTLKELEDEIKSALYKK